MSELAPVAIGLLRAGASVLAVASLGFGIPGAFGAVHLVRTGEVWTFLGFPTYGPGRFGTSSSVTHSVLFVLACLLGAVAAALLWWPAVTILGAFLALAAIAAQAVFWVGFILPFGPPLGVIATAAIVAGLLLR